MLLLLPQPVAGQTQRCLTLPENTPCGKTYQGYPISGDYVSVQNFTDQINQFIADINQVAQQFQDPVIGCSGPTLKDRLLSLRFQESLVCSREVGTAIHTRNCPVPAGMPPHGPLLCTNTCQAMIASVQSVLQDTSICKPSNGGAFLINDFKAYCASAAFNLTSNGNQCVGGTNLEAQYAGWRSSALANKFCPQLNDSICKSFLPQSNDTMYIIIGCSAAGGLVLIAVVLLLYRRYQNKRPRDQSTASNTVSKDTYSTPAAKAAAQTSLAPRAGRLKDDSKQEPPKKSLSHTRKSSLNRPKVKQEPQTEVAVNELTDAKSTAQTSKVEITPANKKQSQSEDKVVLTVNPDALDSSYEYVTVHYNYASAAPDELDLTKGTRIIVVKKFDDGWAIGINPATGAQGAFPLACCTQGSGNEQNLRTTSHRTSSITSFSISSASLENSINEELGKRSNLLRDLDPE